MDLVTCCIVAIILCSVDNIKVTMCMIIRYVYSCYNTVNAVMGVSNVKKLRPRGEGRKVKILSVSF